MSWGIQESNLSRLTRTVHEAMHAEERPLYKKVERFVWLLIALSMATFGLELALPADHPAMGPITLADRLILWLFVLELTLRIGSYRPPRLRHFDLSAIGRLRVHIWDRVLFCLRPLVLVDLVTILALVPALRGLRALRLLRLLRSVRLFRHSSPLRAVSEALASNQLLYLGGFGILGLAVIIGGLSLYLVEGPSNSDLNTIQDGLWWAVVTVTTVGFGDIVPHTPLGRTIGAALMICGMFTLAIFAGVVGNTLLAAVLTIREEQFRMSNTMGHVLICGYDQGSSMLLETLLEELDLHERQLVIFAPGERPADIPPEFRWVSGDPTKKSELPKGRFADASAVVLVGPRDCAPQAADAQTILTVFTLRAHLDELDRKMPRKQPLYIVAEILEAENVAHAKAAGADEVIETTRMGFSLLSHAVAYPGTAEVWSAIGAAGSQSLYVAPVPPEFADEHSFHLLAAQVKRASGALIIGLYDPIADKYHLNPKEGVYVPDGWKLLYLAPGPALPNE